jgi:hypothetical protein
VIPTRRPELLSELEVVLVMGAIVFGFVWAIFLLCGADGACWTDPGTYCMAARARMEAP